LDIFLQEALIKTLKKEAVKMNESFSIKRKVCHNCAHLNPLWESKTMMTTPMYHYIVCEECGKLLQVRRSLC